MNEMSPEVPERRAGKNDRGHFGDDALKFVWSEWDRIWSTKESLERRAITLITASGVLVTLVFGFSAAVRKGHTFANFDPAEKVGLGVSLSLFAVAALMAVVTNKPRSWDVPDFADVLGIDGKWLDSQPNRPEDIPPIARVRLAMDSNWKRIDRMATLLAFAFALQMLAIAALALVVGIVVK